jgi:hypothetical protein
MIFDYYYSTGSGKRSRRTGVTSSAWRIAGASLPQFGMCPEGMLHRILERFGMQDIDVEDHPTFSRLYHVWGKDRESVKRTLARGLAAALSASPGWWLQAEGEWVMLYRGRGVLKPQEIPQFLEDAAWIVRAFELPAAGRWA